MKTSIAITYAILAFATSVSTQAGTVESSTTRASRHVEEANAEDEAPRSKRPSRAGRGFEMHSKS